MSDADRVRWDARYAAPGDRMGAAPKPIVTGLAPHLPASGEALDLACGEGQAAVWLAANGLRTTGIDVSGVGLDKARARAEAAGVEVRWIHADLDGWDPGDQQWDVVLCIHFLDRVLVPRIRTAVRPGGLLAMEVLTEGQYGAAPNELLGWFTGPESPEWHVL